jgi:hypothetical protein
MIQDLAAKGYKIGPLSPPVAHPFKLKSQGFVTLQVSVGRRSTFILIQQREASLQAADLAGCHALVQ